MSPYSAIKTWTVALELIARKSGTAVSCNYWAHYSSSQRLAAKKKERSVDGGPRNNSNDGGMELEVSAERHPEMEMSLLREKRQQTHPTIEPALLGIEPNTGYVASPATKG